MKAGEDMFCYKCGNENKDNVQFCVRCGEKIVYETIGDYKKILSFP